MLRNCVVLLAGSLVFAGLCFSASLTAEQKELNVKSFETVWTTVRDAHWDPQMGGVDWKAAHDEFLPKVEKAGDMDSARAAMSVRRDLL